MRSLLRYGVLTASGIAGGRAGLKVDSAATRAALSRNGRMKAISRLVSGTEMAGVVKRKSRGVKERIYQVSCLALFLVEMVE